MPSRRALGHPMSSTYTTPVRKGNIEYKFSIFLLGNLNCASFVAGMLESILCTSGFVCSIELK